ncbi:uncharacterized protein [Triticum aestivum]|uniref:uncharacterized protein n=1 Tax=Triticum aestivum TaxID=4565 RepID=UPI001D002720|nr:uncharacterized protein LOC123052048 [Triticum aestivum]
MPYGPVLLHLTSKNDGEIWLEPSSARWLDGEIQPVLGLLPLGHALPADLFPTTGAPAEVAGRGGASQVRPWRRSCSRRRPHRRGAPRLPAAWRRLNPMPSAPVAPSPRAPWWSALAALVLAVATAPAWRPSPPRRLAPAESEAIWARRPLPARAVVERPGRARAHGGDSTGVAPLS